MRYAKWLKLGAVGAALLLIPRRSSRVVSDSPSNQNSPSHQNTSNSQNTSKRGDSHSKQSASDS